MTERRYLHSCMRMYQGMKFLERSNTPQYAHRTVKSLNNRHPYDARDLSFHGNIARVFGLWDRARQLRDIPGKVRTVTSPERKPDPEARVSRNAELTGLGVRR